MNTCDLPLPLPAVAAPGATTATAAAEKVLLLVDDEPNILAALTRLFRRDGYKILTANNGAEGLAILKQQPAHVIVSDQRMPEMVGSEFLALAKEMLPDTIRIILSGYTELSSVTDAINQGAVFKFLTKPWDDDLLRSHVREAFVQHQMREENLRLTAELKITNKTLHHLVDELDVLVEQRTQELKNNLVTLQVDQEILDRMPIGVIGMDEDGLIASTNQLARELFNAGPLIANDARTVLPAGWFPPPTGQAQQCLLNQQAVEVRFSKLGQGSRGRGWLVILIPEASHGS